VSDYVWRRADGGREGGDSLKLLAQRAGSKP